MTTRVIFDIIAAHAHAHAHDVLPELAGLPFSGEDTLRALGANFIGHAEIVLPAPASPGLRIAPVELAEPRNMGELADLLAARGARVA